MFTNHRRNSHSNARRQADSHVQPWMESTASQSDTNFTYPQNLPNALALIVQALSGESEDRMAYTWLIDNAPTDEDKQIIAGIRDNEINHFGLFRQIYHEITGRPAPIAQESQFVPPATYCEGLSRALFGEQGAVQRYRQILYAMQTRVHINILTEIITDELRHGTLYNYLYTRNGCHS